MTGLLFWEPESLTGGRPCRRFLLSSKAVVRHLGNTLPCTWMWCYDMFWMWCWLNGCSRIMQWAGTLRGWEDLMYGVHKVHKIKEVEQREQQLWFTAGRKVWGNYTVCNATGQQPLKTMLLHRTMSVQGLWSLFVRAWVSHEAMCCPIIIRPIHYMQPP